VSLLLTPEPMQRTLIVASKGQQGVVIETLHKLRVAHFIDHQESQGEFSEFKLGHPLPSGAPASERLVRVRAILRHVGIEGAEPGTALSVSDIERKLASQLDAIERDVNAAHETRESLIGTLSEQRDLASKLAPLAALPLKLDDYRGYDSLTAYVGRADPGFEADALAAAPDALLVKGPVGGGVFALFVPREQARAASEALYKHGFQEVEVPAGTGTPEERLREIESERTALENRAAQAKTQLERLASEQKDLLLAAEEHLSIIVEKAEAPLSFASTENAFVVDAWVPRLQVPTLELQLHKATGGNVYVKMVESGESHAHNNPAHGAQADAAFDAAAKEDHHVNMHAQPPTKYSNPAATRSFEWFTELFATPRYNEVDPTSIFAFFFPLFFGFMVGDLGLGILIAIIGWLLIKKLPKVDGMKQLGTAFVLAGLIAAAFGGLVFHDALGIPFGFTHHMEEELTADHLALACTPEVYEKLGETTWGCLLGGNAWVSEPLIGKVTDIPTMLLLSLAAAFVHLGLGLLLGIRNEWGHGAKHVVAKFSYLMLLLAFYPAAIALLNAEFWTNVTGLSATTAYCFAGGGFLLGAVLLGWAEGAPGVLEIPTMFSNILSYLRLGAVAIAKGAMAVAFNNLTLIAALTGGSVVLVLGLVGFVIAQVALLVLGILSGGIQALRLNFVEMYTKFYKGGGKRYKPFGREPKATLPPSPSIP